MKTYHCDGGAFIEPPEYKFHNAYFSIVSARGKLIHFAKNIGDLTANIAEYEAIEWVISHIKERPIRVLSDSKVALSWAEHGGKSAHGLIPPLNLKGVALVHASGNKADSWNAKNYSFKQPKEFYYERYKQSQREVEDLDAEYQAKLLED